MCTGAVSVAAIMSGTWASTAPMKPFMSVVPRPYRRPSASHGANGSADQSWPSTGTTSVWPDRMMPGTSAGPMVAMRLALRITGSSNRVHPTPQPSR